MLLKLLVLPQGIYESLQNGWGNRNFQYLVGKLYTYKEMLKLGCLATIYRIENI